MKIITSKEPITFKVTSSRVYDITPEGVNAPDADAAIILDRLGMAVSVVDAPEHEVHEDAPVESEVEAEVVVHAPEPEPMPEVEADAPVEAAE